MSVDNHPDRLTALATRLNRLRGEKIGDRYERSLEELVRLLRLDSEFATVNRATLSRWITGRGDPRRMTRAVQQLERFVADSPTIRIGALHPLAEGLPLWFLPPTSSSVPGSLRKVFDKLKEYRIGTKHHLHPSMRWFPVGGDALQSLQAGDIDVALASRSLGEETLKNHTIKRLCSLCEMPIGFISQEPISGPWMLEHAPIGVQARTAYRTAVKQSLDRLRITPASIRELRDHEEAITLFRDKHALSIIVGSPVWLEELAAKLQSPRHKFTARPYDPFFGRLEISLFVRLDSVDPAAVRRLLAALLDAIRLVNDHMDSESFQRDVASMMGVRPQRAKEALRAYSFSLRALQPETTLQLWNAELIDGSGTAKQPAVHERRRSARKVTP